MMRPIPEALPMCFAGRATKTARYHLKTNRRMGMRVSSYLILMGGRFVGSTWALGRSAIRWGGFFWEVFREVDVENGRARKGTSMGFGRKRKREGNGVGRWDGDSEVMASEVVVAVYAAPVSFGPRVS